MSFLFFLQLIVIICVEFMKILSELCHSDALFLNFFESRDFIIQKFPVISACCHADFVRVSISIKLALIMMKKLERMV